MTLLKEWGKSIDERIRLMEAGKLPASMWLVAEIFVYIVIMIVVTGFVAGIVVFMMGVLGKLKISREDARGIKTCCIILAIFFLIMIAAFYHDGIIVNEMLTHGFMLLAGLFGFAGSVGLLYYLARFMKYNL